MPLDPLTSRIEQTNRPSIFRADGPRNILQTATHPRSAKDIADSLSLANPTRQFRPSKCGNWVDVLDDGKWKHIAGKLVTGQWCAP